MVSMNQPNRPECARPVTLTIELGRPGADPDSPEAERVIELQTMIEELVNAAIALDTLNVGDEPVSIKVANQAEFDKLNQLDEKRRRQIESIAATAASIIDRLKQSSMSRVLNVYSEERLS